MNKRSTDFPASWLVNSSAKEWRYSVINRETAGKLDDPAYIVSM